MQARLLLLTVTAIAAVQSLRPDLHFNGYETVTIAAQFGLEMGGRLNVTFSDFALNSDWKPWGDDTDFVGIWVEVFQYFGDQQAPPDDNPRRGGPNICSSSVLSRNRTEMSVADVLNGTMSVAGTKQFPVMIWPKMRVTSANGFQNFNYITRPTAFSLVREINDPSLEGMWRVLFINCAPGLSVAFTSHLDAYNRGDGQAKDYLQTGERPLVAVHAIFCALFFAASFVWWRQLRPKGVNGPRVLRIHWLMLLLVILKAFASMLHSIRYSCLQHDWDVDTVTVFYYIFNILRGGLDVAVMALIGSGWMLLKHGLSAGERIAAVTATCLQLVKMVVHLLSSELTQGSTSWVAAHLISDMMNFSIFVVLAFLIYRTHKKLKNSAPVDGRAAVNSARFRRWNVLYVGVMTYFYVAEVLVDQVAMVGSFRASPWVGQLFKEIITLLFYFCVGWQFRPVAAELYFEVQSEDSSCAVQVSDNGARQPLVHRSRSLRSPEVAQVEANLIMHKLYSLPDEEET